MDVGAGTWARIGARHPGVRLAVLLGSRATGEHRQTSDWDIGVLLDDGADLFALRANIVQSLGTDAVDLVDLRAASAVLRRDAAVGGRVLLEREDGAFAGFQVAAAGFWCDVEPVLREAQRDVLRVFAG